MRIDAEAHPCGNDGLGLGIAGVGDVFVAAHTVQGKVREIIQASGPPCEVHDAAAVVVQLAMYLHPVHRTPNMTSYAINSLKTMG